MEPDSISQSSAGRWFSTRVGSVVSIAMALASGLALRLWMFKHFFDLHGDPLIYGGLAKNLLLHGQYLVSIDGSSPVPTLIRLPGYPLFLALCFRIFGMENYASAAWVQIAMELAGCLLLAGFAARIAPTPLRTGTAHCTLWLAALCPFTANYAVLPLTEAPTLFALALALWSMARFCDKPGWLPALCFTFAVTFAAMLRPDGILVAAALAPPILYGLWKEEYGKAIQAKELAGCPTLDCHPERSAAESKDLLFNSLRPGWVRKHPQLSPAPKLARIAVVCTLLALAPFAAWTGRNWRVFHVFEPLAPRYANDPGQETYPGWQRWVKTWCLDYVSTYDIYWPVPGSPLDLTKLPSRAFDSPAQYAETVALASDYNDRDKASDIVPDVDARFAKLAEERIHSHPLRYYLWLPLGRVADMWLRPRVENLNIDLDWWVYAHHNSETRFSWACAALNLLYLVLGFAGLCLRPRFWLPMLAYFLLRSLVLATIEAPESRYTLECFPMLFALGGVALYRLTCTVLLLVGKTNASAGKA